ncbi:peroxiredoxin-like family protein [Fodinicola feengrottensis]|uniref:peroxiredoxin-like family protein n=1 Tax=Fodinicola feengrottensis TaxID=435914 RepID=UPI00244268E3|nr:peroxiredoxin-like family protein [Fodinicola feengrottensis]
MLSVFFGQAAMLGESDLESKVLAAGSRAPDFSLPDPQGDVVDLAAMLARGPVVLTFYRGAWCPMCNLQLPALRDSLPAFTAAGASLVAVSPQLPDGSLTMAERHALTFPVLSDLRNVTARQYGLVFTMSAEVVDTARAIGVDFVAVNGNDTWELPIPATFVIDRQGVIRWVQAHADWRQRPQPQAILDALTALADEPE